MRILIACFILLVLTGCGNKSEVTALQADVAALRGEIAALKQAQPQQAAENAAILQRDAAEAERIIVQLRGTLAQAAAALTNNDPQNIAKMKSDIEAASARLAKLKIGGSLIAMPRKWCTCGE